MDSHPGRDHPLATPHHPLTWVERHFGYGVARDFAGHTDRKGASTTTYIRATVEEAATALSAMTGEPHPLARHVGPGDTQ